MTTLQISLNFTLGLKISTPFRKKDCLQACRNKNVIKLHLQNTEKYPSYLKSSKGFPILILSEVCPSFRCNEIFYFSFPSRLKYILIDVLMAGASGNKILQIKVVKENI